LNPIDHYKLEVGLLQKDDSADFIVVDNFNNFNVLQTYIKGILVAENGKTLISSVSAEMPNHFVTDKINASTLSIKATGNQIRIIEALEGQLITNTIIDSPLVKDGHICSDIERDYLKMVVINRYEKAPPAIAFIKNFGLKSGAISSTVAHDSHNIIAVGVSDEAIAKAVNLLVEVKGGIAVVDNESEHVLPLPVAGLMTNNDGYQVAQDYETIDALVKKSGCTLNAPFMTLSFMALLVIPQLKLSDKGLFDGKTFSFTTLEVA
ncbi:MAG: adenine deaminase C-terminal domain-containing protein, partial [Bacteroidales bacterium]|nr:adenine deaminase C-terminal domain-containing protein [Bacteroidales bacterium]